MLISMNIDNFKSFSNPAKLEMVCASKIASNLSHKISAGKRSGGNLSLLRYGVIFGANAAGKSNVVDAFTFIQNVMQEGLTPSLGRMYCRTDPANAKRDSTFELQITIDGKFYAYGFTARLNEMRITGEWLDIIKPDGGREMLFENENGGVPAAGDAFKLSESDKKRFVVYADDFAGTTKTLFITSLNQGKKYAQASKLELVREIFGGIVDKITVIKPESLPTRAQYLYDETALEQITDIIKTFDTGISDIAIEDVPNERLGDVVPLEALELISEQIDTYAREAKEWSPHRMVVRNSANIFVVDVLSGDDIKIRTIKWHHGKGIFDFAEESDGTRRLFDLMVMLLTHEEDVVFVADELDRSLHPALVAHFLELFDEYHADDNVQLIFTTHEPSLMEQSRFRRDEIWFVERDAQSGSTIFPLDKFTARYDTRLSKAYLEGRYGALPIFKQCQLPNDGGDK